MLAGAACPLCPIKVRCARRSSPACPMEQLAGASGTRPTATSATQRASCAVRSSTRAIPPFDWFQSMFVSCPATANKVTSCFLNNSQCTRDDRWYASHCDITAYSISPDRLIGFNGNYGGGLWTADTGYAWLDVPYFSGDLVYGCWK